MATQITYRTTDGRIGHAISYSVNPASIPTDPAKLGALMQGGVAYGSYHLQDAHGWIALPANQIAAIISIQPGAPT